MPQPKTKAGSKNGRPKILSLEDIQATEDLGEQTVEVQEWGGAVKIRGLAHGEVVDIFRELDLEVDDSGNLRVPAARAGEWQLALVAAGLVEPEVDEEALSSLSAKSTKAIARVSDAISELSGLGSLSDGPGAAGDAAEKRFLAR